MVFLCQGIVFALIAGDLVGIFLDQQAEKGVSTYG
jgi:hypothetical protein